MSYDFRDESGITRLSGELLNMHGTQGQVLTVDVQGKIAPQTPTGGTSPGVPNDVYVGGAYGNDTNDGLSPGTAVATFAKAATLAQSFYTIHLCGPLTETCVLASFRRLNGHGFAIRAPSDSTDCLQIAAGAQQWAAQNVVTQAPSTSWTGSGVNCQGNWGSLFNWSHSTFASHNPPGTNGNGFFGTHGEGNLIMSATVTNCGIAFNLAEEFTENTFINLTSSGNAQALYINGVYTKGVAATASSGSCTFVRFKATGGFGGSQVPCAWIQNNQHGGGHPNGHQFIMCDWDEGSGQPITIESQATGMVFQRQTIAGGSTWTDNGTNYYFPPPVGGTFVAPNAKLIGA